MKIDARKSKVSSPDTPPPLSPLGATADHEPNVSKPSPDTVRLDITADASVDIECPGLDIRLQGKDVMFSLDGIGAVTVGNLAWVTEHRITRIFESVSHFIRLVGGGEVRFAYCLDGALLELSAERVGMTIAPDGKTLTFSPLAVEAAPLT